MPTPREISANNPPEWMLDERMLQKAAEISARLVAEGYSEEQAYEIALERLQDDGEEPLEGGTLREIDENLIDADTEPVVGRRIRDL